MVGLDSLDPIKPASASGSKYYLDLLDWFTRMVFVQDWTFTDPAVVNNMCSAASTPLPHMEVHFNIEDRYSREGDIAIVRDED